MINVIVCIPGSVAESEVLRVLASVGEVIPRDDHAISLRAADGRGVWINREDRERFVEEYEEEDLALIHRHLGADYNKYIMTYYEGALVREIALAMSRAWPTVVDIDGSFFGTGEQFAAELATGPSWALTGRERNG